MNSVRTLMNGIVDYAGFFPPAKLGMGPVVRNYGSYIESEHSWMLGRLIVPVSGLGDFEAHASSMLSKNEEGMPWLISVVTGKDLGADIERIAAFNDTHQNPERGLATIDAIELKTKDSKAIDAALDLIPEWLTPFFEIPITGDVRGLVAAIAGTEGAAKVRLGGVEVGAFPVAEDVAKFISACAKAGTPFKATAGLHHPLRGSHQMTYEPDSPSCTMHGFLNVFLAAAMAHGAKASEEEVLKALHETSLENFEFHDDVIVWGKRRLPVEKIAQARERFALSFGSCSFEEPIQDLKTLQLL
ncbi:MAG: hypothetical protein EA376_10930 [Phycisphaeraceae bacterium]|nr:MAG: hypothetical protein EA376_10930 [Phycisphaeraceae bacterium]